MNASSATPDPWDGWSTESKESYFGFSKMFGHINLEGTIQKISVSPEKWKATAWAFALSVEVNDPFLKEEFSDLVSAKQYVLNAARELS